MINYIYLSAEQYSKETNLGVEEVKRQCRIGKIPHLRTQGGYYKIKVCKNDCVSREEYERVVQENIELKQILSNINALSNLKGEKDG